MVLLRTFLAFACWCQTGSTQTDTNDSACAASVIACLAQTSIFSEKSNRCRGEDLQSFVQDQVCVSRRAWTFWQFSSEDADVDDDQLDLQRSL
jgi:hypothetical protein